MLNGFRIFFWSRKYLCMCAYQGVRNVRFFEDLACFVFLKHPFWDSPFCLITDVVFFEFAEKIRPDKYFLFLDGGPYDIRTSQVSSELQCKLYDWFLYDCELRDKFIFLYVDILLLVPKCKFIIKNSSLKCWLCLADKSNFH